MFVECISKKIKNPFRGDILILLSGNLLNNLTNIEYLTPESIGKIKLRSKEEEVELFSILEAA